LEPRSPGNCRHPADDQERKDNPYGRMRRVLAGRTSLRSGVPNEASRGESRWANLENGPTGWTRHPHTQKHHQPYTGDFCQYLKKELPQGYLRSSQKKLDEQISTRPRFVPVRAKRPCDAHHITTRKHFVKYRSATSHAHHLQCNPTPPGCPRPNSQHLHITDLENRRPRPSTGVTYHLHPYHALMDDTPEPTVPEA
jgi:hypothetical protein